MLSLFSVFGMKFIFKVYVGSKVVDLYTDYLKSFPKMKDRNYMLLTVSVPFSSRLIDGYDD